MHGSGVILHRMLMVVFGAGASYDSAPTYPPRPYEVLAQMRAAFPRQLYQRRALMESVISAVKRKPSARAPGRRLETQRVQALLLGLAYNVYRLRPCRA